MKTLIAFIFSLTLSLNAQEKTNTTYTKKGALTQVVAYHTNGTIAQKGVLKNNKLHGEWISYDEEGRKLTMGNYDNGVKTGKWLFWKENQLLEVDYIDNKPDQTVQWTKASLASIEE